MSQSIAGGRSLRRAGLTTLLSGVAVVTLVSAPSTFAGDASVPSATTAQEPILIAANGLVITRRNVDEPLQQDSLVMVDWRMLGGLNFETGQMTDTLKKLNGKRVRIPGFIVPLEDYEEESAEFLLVPYFGACVHTPPPPPNQLVYVKMVGDKKTKIGWWDPVWMEGTLKVEAFESIYGLAGYLMDGTGTKPYGEN